MNNNMNNNMNNSLIIILSLISIELNKLRLIILLVSRHTR